MTLSVSSALSPALPPSYLTAALLFNVDLYVYVCVSVCMDELCVCMHVCRWLSEARRGVNLLEFEFQSVVA